MNLLNSSSFSDKYIWILALVLMEKVQMYLDALRMQLLIPVSIDDVDVIFEFFLSWDW